MIKLKNGRDGAFLEIGMHHQGPGQYYSGNFSKDNASS